MDSIRRQNPLAHLIHHCHHSSGAEVFLYLTFDRRERISDFCFWSKTLGPSFDQDFAELNRLLQGEDLSSFGALDFTKYEASFLELVSLVDGAITAYRQGTGSKAMEALNFKKELICPCHALCATDLSQAVIDHPHETNVELQGRLGFGVTCPSCIAVCHNFLEHWRAANRIGVAKESRLMRILGHSQARLALMIQDYLISKKSEVKVLSLKGFEVGLDVWDEELHQDIRSHFGINFLFLQDCCS